VGGHYFTYSETSPICFNPFWLPDGMTPDTEKRESIKTLLLALWKKEDEAFLRSEYVALSNALQQYYAMLATHRDIFPCFDSFYEFLEGVFAKMLAGERVQPGTLTWIISCMCCAPITRAGIRLSPECHRTAGPAATTLYRL